MNGEEKMESNNNINSNRYIEKSCRNVFLTQILHASPFILFDFHFCCYRSCCCYGCMKYSDCLHCLNAPNYKFVIFFYLFYHLSVCWSLYFFCSSICFSYIVPRISNIRFCSRCFIISTTLT